MIVPYVLFQKGASREVEQVRLGEQGGAAGMETCDRRVVRANAPGGGPLSSPPLPLPAASIGGTFVCIGQRDKRVCSKGEARDTWGSREGEHRHKQDSHGCFFCVAEGAGGCLP
jgi:hypothetical protein